MSITFTFATLEDGCWHHGFDDDFDVNMSNANAGAVLAELGVEFDYCGSIDPSDLAARVMLEGIGTERVAVLHHDPLVGPVLGQSKSRHLDALGRLATEAMRRGTWIGWS